MFKIIIIPFLKLLSIVCVKSATLFVAPLHTFATVLNLKYIKMNSESLRNEYRSLRSGDNSKWKQLTSIGEFIWDDVYAISLVNADATLGLPFEFQGNEIINLVVKDQSRNGNTQSARVIVQTLTRVERTTGEVLTYTRTRTCKNGEHVWGEWDRISADVSVVNHTETTATIMPNVLNLWDEVTELNITLAPPTDKTRASEYIIQFTSGAVPTMLTLPDSIKWANGNVPVIAADKIYQISILNGLAVYLEFGNSNL